MNLQRRRRRGTHGFSEQAQIALRIRRDPVWFFRDVLGIEPWELQIAIALSVRDNRRTCVPSCHGAGKSKISAGIALWFMLAFPGCKVATTAPSFRQVKNIIWANMRQMHENALIPLGGEVLTTRWELEPEWYAFGFTTKDPDAVSGIHAPEILVLLDEAAGIPMAIWKAIEGLTSSAMPRVLSIGNPTDPTGGFAKEAADLERFNKSVGLFHISAFDTPNVKSGKIVIPGLTTLEWVEERKRDWGEESPLYIAKVLGRFPDQADDALIRMSWAETAKAAEFEPGDPRILSVDVARYGRNRTVAYMREGRRYRCVLRKMGLSIPETAREVWKLATELEAEELRVDDSGVGGGVTDILRENVKAAGRGPVIDAFNGQNVPNEPERFANRRAEAYWSLRDAFREGQIDIDEEASDNAINQLTSIRYRTRNLGRQEVIQIESKEEMEARGMPSPDDADAMMQAAAPARASKLVRLAWGS